MRESFCNLMIVSKYLAFPFLLQAAHLSEKPVAPPPGLSTSWAFPVASTNNSSSGSIEMFQEDEDPCAICHEDLTTGSTITLECAHKFHDEVGTTRTLKI